MHEKRGKQQIMDVLKLSWMEAYKLAKAYRIQHGNLDVPSTYWTKNGYEEVKVKKGVFNLGRWLSKERYGNVENENYNITDRHRELLNEIDMIWNIHEYRWNKKYSLAKAYYEHYGNLNIPNNYWTKNGYEETTKNKDDRDIINLGQWISDQRTVYNYHWLCQEREEKLNEIGMISDKINYEWNKMYDLAKAYYEHHGDLYIPSRYKTKNGYEEITNNEDDHDVVNLGQWIFTQRVNSQLSKEKEDKLNKIGMVWNISEFIWNKRYGLAKAYYEHHGNLDMPRRIKIKNDCKDDNEIIILKKWLDRQRKRYKGKTRQTQENLTTEQIKSLEELNITWFLTNDQKYQEEIINSSNSYRKKIEIYNRFRTYLNTLSDNNMMSKEQMNQDFIDQLDGKNKTKTMKK